jgi:hypothetical protein
VCAIAAALAWCNRAELSKLSKPTNPTEFWALIGGLFNAAILVVAVIGLKSLVLTRRGMLTEATREVRSLAIERCEEFARELIPLNNPILKTFAEKSVAVFVVDVHVVAFDPDPAEHLEAARKWVNGLPAEVRGGCITMMNRLEGWAMYFTHQLADPTVAYGPCAPLFLSAVLQFYAIYLVLRAGNASGKFPNTVKLFKAWRADLKGEQAVQLEALLARLKESQASGPLAPMLGKPLGTDLV